jgi:hypothetical protein
MTQFIFFRQFFDDLSAIFSACEDIDQHCVVLEPELPNFIVPYRRIALGTLCSVHVSVVCSILML